ncbi:response regulator [Luteimonas saliphila]|uniref:response regulator n=1 Tax=Luteimonas saliphila TaxID=2804919 RepID=UPI00192D9071|nr:response regulator transcription factor [Luteimonas saliphila]
MSIRILTVDDHPMLREGVAAMLNAETGMEVVGEAGDAEQGITEFRRLRPDVTLMDLQMRGMGGLNGIRTIRGECASAKIIALTTYRGDVNVREVLGAGARGYLLKTALRAELMDCIRRVHAGGRYVSSELCAEIAAHAGDEPLTAREYRILELVAEGMENKRISSSLGISVETVKSHVTRIFEKLQTHNRTEAIRIALRRGLLREPID